MLLSFVHHGFGYHGNSLLSYFKRHTQKLSRFIKPEGFCLVQYRRSLQPVSVPFCEVNKCNAHLPTDITSSCQQAVQSAAEGRAGAAAAVQWADSVSSAHRHVTSDSRVELWRRRDGKPPNETECAFLILINYSPALLRPPESKLSSVTSETFCFGFASLYFFGAPEK